MSELENCVLVTLALKIAEIYSFIRTSEQTDGHASERDQEHIYFPWGV